VFTDSLGNRGIFQQPSFKARGNFEFIIGHNAPPFFVSRPVVCRGRSDPLQARAVGQKRRAQRLKVV
jgi:hypothetical protein